MEPTSLIVCPTTVDTISLNVTATLVTAVQAELVVDVTSVDVLKLDLPVGAAVLEEDNAEKEDDVGEDSDPVIAMSEQVK